MNADNLRKNAGRWVRVGVLTLTTLGPVINVVSSQLRERSRKLQKDTVKRSQETLTTITQSQRQLLSVGASLSDTLTELKSNPYSQELLKRGSELAGTLSEQGGKLSHELAERGSKARQVVVERGSDIARDLTERGSKASQELAKQSQRTTREISQRTRHAAQQAQRDLLRASSQVREQATSPDYAARFWSICGFIVGLVSAITAAYFFIRRRIQSNPSDNNAYQLSNHSMLNGASISTPMNKVTTPTTAVAPSVVTADTSPAPSAPSTSNALPSDTTSVEAASIAPTAQPTQPAQDTVIQDTTTPIPESLEASETSQAFESLMSPQISDAALEDVITSEAETPEASLPAAQDMQSIQDIQDTPAHPDTLPENTPSFNAAAEPLTASPESEGVTSAQTTDAGTIAVEVPADTLASPVEEEPTQPLESQPTEVTNVVTEPEPFHTIETPGSAERSYGMGNEVAAISTGMPVVSTDETIIPVEGLGTATVSGVVSDPTSPDVEQEQDRMSNTLTNTVEQVLNKQTAQSESVAGPAILGVVSTKRYYPVETPLSVLRTPNGDELDIIYFANEDEAKAQGYNAAE